MIQYKMYTTLAHLWPLFDTPEGYAPEAKYWIDALQAKLGQQRHEVLYMGAGGGCHMSHLTQRFLVTAVDISEQMLSISKELNPEVEHLQGDMRTVRLNRKFKAVLIHDGICYMLTESDLQAAFATAKHHLERGGLIITVPDFYSETFPGTRLGHWSAEKDNTEINAMKISVSS